MINQQRHPGVDRGIGDHVIVVKDEQARIGQRAKIIEQRTDHHLYRGWLGRLKHGVGVIAQAREGPRQSGDERNPETGRVGITQIEGEPCDEW